MKAITIWQPWASLIACGAKKYETRGWPTKYRGPIAIHAAAKDPRTLPQEVRKALGQYAGYTGQNGLKLGQLDELPRGAIIATAELVNVWHIVHNPGTDVDMAKNIPIGAESLTTDKHATDFGDYFVPTEQEMELGDWTPGRYAWELQNVTFLSDPIPEKGKQGLWYWEKYMILRHKGRDSWDRPVYEDETGKLWKDVEPRADDGPKLCSALYNAFDGEPDTPLEYMERYKNKEIVFIPKRDTWTW
ncbi:ASCH domain-containing protein [uncultured Adlercreutzia sp.]|mgnify:CR=1 FL=1|jgi:hypothetical protein|uniref:ASCH domain-containing protein n=1 Tax=uncultured Adlercreutzia sp. TaxID=875803 RepID=UPI00272EDCA9|nr:ASCH domain-containing protein [uncultured Adlercreutzia sp.]